MLKFKLGALVGFGLGWLVGSGRAAKLWDDLQGSAADRAGQSRPVAVKDEEQKSRPDGSQLAAGG
jgi:hypothetical protein